MRCGFVHECMQIDKGSNKGSGAFIYCCIEVTFVHVRRSYFLMSLVSTLYLWIESWCV